MGVTLQRRGSGLSGHRGRWCNGPVIFVRAAWLLPLWWLTPVVVTAVAALAAAWFTSASFVGVDVGFDGLRAALELPDGSITRNVPAAYRLSVAALAAGAVWWLRYPLVWIALGLTSASSLVFEAVFQRRGWAWAAGMLGIALAAVGVRHSVSAGSYAKRLVQASGLLLPPALLMTAFGGRRFAGPVFTIAPVLLVVLFGAWGHGKAAALTSPLRSAAAAIVCTLLLVIAVRWSGAQVRKYESVRVQRELAGVPDAPAPAAYDKLFFQRGVSFVRDGYGAYHPHRSARFFDALRGYGVDAVALIPYGRASGGGVRFESAPDPVYPALAKLARARGIRILLKPQLLAFGARFPGEIEVAEEAARQKWFESYRAFILHWAGIAATIHADLFCVGTELVKMSRYESEWREIIRQVRDVYPGPIVYAATQGEEFENLRFWDALDYIGLNNYYPLPDTLDASDVVRKVEAVQQRYNKPVLFTETGYASVAEAHRAPWSEPVAAVSLEHQVRCYEALFRAFYGKPWFYGMYWWKISADGRGGPEDRSLTPWRKPAMETLRRWYTSTRNSLH